MPPKKKFALKLLSNQPKSKASSFETGLFDFLNSSVMSSGATSTNTTKNSFVANNNYKNDEINVQENLMKYLINESSGKPVSGDMLLKHAKITDADGTVADAVDEISVQILIEVYCTPGEGFGAAYFKQQIKDLGLSVLTGLKLFSMLDSWRKGTVVPEWINK